MNDLKTVYDCITAKRAQYDALDGYYHGNQPTVYLTKRMREIFRPLDISFTENWCSVVIDACDERINLTGFEANDSRAKDILRATWERNSVANEAADIHTDALVLGESYAIVWPGEDGRAEVFYNDARMIHVCYAADNPRRVSMAGKLWCGEDGRAKMTLYYPDHLEYYTSTAKMENVSSAESFTPDTSAHPTGFAPNPYNQVPVFHFKMNRSRSSDLVNVIPLQNGINKMLSDMMVAAEYGAYSQRWIISQGDTSGLKNSPGAVWDLPAGDGQGQDTSVGQFQSTDLKNYLDAIDRLSMAIGVITRTPKHYFFTQGGDPSGEALIALEAPLNKKAQDRIDRFRPVWRELAAFVCQIENVSVAAADITPVFQRPETIQPKTAADITKVRTDAGVPLATALRWEGKTEAEIEAMQAEQEEAAGKAQASLGVALMQAERQMKEAGMPGTPGDGKEIQKNQNLAMVDGGKQNA